MTNHVHLIAIPENSASLARALGQAHWRYTRYFSQRYRRSGHLWQNRFYSCALGQEHLFAALTYVALNPVRAGLVGAAEEYPWSSAVEHAREPGRRSIIDAAKWASLGLHANWKAHLAATVDEETSAELRRSTYSRFPLGSDQFVLGLERNAGRTLRPKRRATHAAATVGR